MRKSKSGCTYHHLRSIRFIDLSKASTIPKYAPEFTGIVVDKENLFIPIEEGFSYKTVRHTEDESSEVQTFDSNGQVLKTKFYEGTARWLDRYNRLYQAVEDQPYMWWSLPATHEASTVATWANTTRVPEEYLQSLKHRPAIPIRYGPHPPLPEGVSSSTSLSPPSEKIWDWSGWTDAPSRDPEGAAAEIQSEEFSDEEGDQGGESTGEHLSWTGSDID